MYVDLDLTGFEWDVRQRTAEAIVRGDTPEPRDLLWLAEGYLKLIELADEARQEIISLESDVNSLKNDLEDAQADLRDAQNTDEQVSRAPADQLGGITYEQIDRIIVAKLAPVIAALNSLSADHN